MVDENNALFSALNQSTQNYRRDDRRKLTSDITTRKGDVAMVRTKQQKQAKDATAQTTNPPAREILKQVKFKYRTEPGADVYIVGSFNDWNPRQTRLRDESGNGRYQASLALAPGRYEYKFVVNGKWRIDPKCQDPIVNRFNTLNGVVTVN